MAELTQEQEAQALAELAELSGTIDSTYTEEETEVDNDEVEEDTSETDSDEEETEVKESKAEKKIKKLLSKKNEATNKAKTLEERLRETEMKLERSDFLAEHPEAKDFMDKIEARREQKWGESFEDAFYYLVWRGEIKTQTRSNGFVGTPNAVTQTKDPRKMSLADKTEYLRQHQSEFANYL